MFLQLDFVANSFSAVEAFGMYFGVFDEARGVDEHLRAKVALGMRFDVGLEMRIVEKSTAADVTERMRRLTMTSEGIASVES